MSALVVMMFGGNVKSIYIILTLVFQGYIFLFSATILRLLKRASTEVLVR